MPEPMQREPAFQVKPYTPKAQAAPKEPGLEWSPLAGYARLPFNGTSHAAVRKCLIAMYGSFPIRLSDTSGDGEVMKAMMYAAGDGGTPYRVLHEALRKYGEIEVRDA